MKIIHVGLAPPAVLPGGLGRYVADLSEAQARIGLNPVILQLHGDEQVPGEQIARVDSRISERLYGFANAILRNCKDADVLDVHFALHASILAIRRPSIPVTVHFHGPWALESLALGERPIVARAKKIIEQAVYRKANAYITLSTSFADLLASEYEVPAKKIFVLPPGVDTNRFRPGPRSDARSRLGLALDRRWLVAVRRLVPRMGLPDLISVVSRLPGDVNLAIVGDGPLYPYLVQLVEKLGLTSRVHFLGKLPDEYLCYAYQAADLSVVPSRELEGFGLVALESFACGTPVVARANGGLKSAVGNFRRDLLVEDMTQDSLAQRISAALELGDLRKDAREYALTHDWKGVATSHLDVYQQITGVWRSSS